MQYLLNIAAFKNNVTNLGPGKRFVIWVQGCPFNCQGCISQEWIPFTKANIIQAEELAKLIINTKDISGITLSGGEPMMQAYGLNHMLKLVKEKRPELNVISFTGFKLKQLKWLEARELLGKLDVIISGLYVDSLNDNRGLRGSSNQKITFLTDRLLIYKDEFDNGERQFEISILDNHLFTTGMPPRKIQTSEI